MNVKERLQKLVWLEPTIPITLARKLRQDEGDSFAESFDRLLPRSKFDKEQTEIVKELVRDLVDLDTIEFHSCSEMSVRLKRNRSLLSQQLGDPIDPAFENIDPKKPKLAKWKSLLDIKFGGADISELSIKRFGSLLFHPKAFHGIPPPLCLVQKSRANYRIIHTKSK